MNRTRLPRSVVNKPQRRRPTITVPRPAAEADNCICWGQDELALDVAADVATHGGADPRSLPGSGG